MADFDVLIAGAGPAGCATALSLATFAPELRVALVDGAAPEALPIGETVPPQINPLLAHLGLSEQFAEDGHCPSYRTVAAWGGARLTGNEFLAQAHQRGWRLDRAAFDRMLVAAASSRGAVVRRARVTAATEAGGIWRLSLSDGASLTARFAVDATGRAAAVARRCRLLPAVVDRLVGCVLRTRSRSDGAEGLMIEACAEGWWYTAALPGGERMLVCLTDADRVRPLDLAGDGFYRLLDATEHVRRVADPGATPCRPLVRPASSACVDTAPVASLLCVGDAASAHDPLAGDGIVQGLRSGIFAAYAVADWLRQGDPRGLSRYRLLLRREFAAYAETLADYYRLEQRWPGSPFWQRRHDRPTAGSRVPAMTDADAGGWRGAAPA